MSEEYNQLLKEYRRLAKRADQRLVRLEAYQHDKGFKTATRWAYAKALNDIKKWSGENAKRFNVKPPENTTSLKAKIQDIKNFIESPTSTKRGIEKVYKKKADTINRKYGTDFDWEDLANYYLSGTAEKLNEQYGSKTVLRAIASIQKTEKSEIEAIKESKSKHLKLQDKIVDKVVNEILSDSGIDILSLL